MYTYRLESGTGKRKDIDVLDVHITLSGEWALRLARQLALLKQSPETSGKHLFTALLMLSQGFPMSELAELVTALGIDPDAILVRMAQEPHGPLTEAGLTQ